jgi:hypothetical protein
MGTGQGPSETRRRIIGRATTVGQMLPLATDDPVIAARAVRRALADAGRRALDVEALVIATPPPLTPEAVATFARRALGPHGATVRLDLVVETGDGASLAELAARRAPRARSPGGIVVAVGIGPDGTTVAVCLDGPPAAQESL